MKVLITGSNGFIGTALTNSIMGRNDIDEVFTVGRKITKTTSAGKPKSYFSVDLSVQFEVEKLFTQIKPDVIFHLAANPIVKLDEKFPTKIWQDNVVATQNLLHFAPEGCKFVFASSIVVYGNVSTEVSAAVETFPIKPTAVYGATKIASEDLVRIYTEMERIVGVSARLSATIGVGASHGIIPDLIEHCRVGSEPYLPIIGDKPGSSKPYVYIDDTVSALMHLVGKTGVYNISSVDSADCEVIGNEILAKFGHINKNRIHWRGEAANWKGDNRTLKISPKKLLESGWQPKFLTAQEAIRQTVQDYKDSYAN